MPEERRAELIDHKYIQRVFELMGPLTRDSEISSSDIRQLYVHKAPQKDDLLYTITFDRSNPHEKSVKEARILNGSVDYEEMIEAGDDTISKRGLMAVAGAKMLGPASDCNIALLKSGGPLDANLISDNVLGVPFSNEIVRPLHVYHRNTESFLTIDATQVKSNPDFSPLARHLHGKMDMIKKFSRKVVDDYRKFVEGGNVDLEDPNIAIAITIASQWHYSSEAQKIMEAEYERLNVPKDRRQLIDPEMIELADKIGNIVHVLEQHEESIFNTSKLTYDKRRGVWYGLSEIGPDWDFSVEIPKKK